VLLIPKDTAYLRCYDLPATVHGVLEWRRSFSCMDTAANVGISPENEGFIIPEYLGK
jgi:hypothetical protein